MVFGGEREACAYPQQYVTGLRERQTRLPRMKQCSLQPLSHENGMCMAPIQSHNA